MMIRVLIAIYQCGGTSRIASELSFEDVTIYKIGVKHLNTDFGNIIQ